MIHFPNVAFLLGYVYTRRDFSGFINISEFTIFRVFGFAGGFYTHQFIWLNIRQSVAKYIVFTFDSGNQNLGIRNQSGTLYFGFTHLHERQNGSTTKLFHLDSSRIRANLLLFKLNPFVCRRNCRLMVVHIVQTHCTWLFSLKVATRI